MNLEAFTVLGFNKKHRRFTQQPSSPSQQWLSSSTPPSAIPSDNYHIEQEILEGRRVLKAVDSKYFFLKVVTQRRQLQRSVRACLNAFLQFVNNM